MKRRRGFSPGIKAWCALAGLVAWVALIEPGCAPRQVLTESAVYHTLLERGRAELVKPSEDRNPKRAVEYLQEASQIRPNDPEPHYLLGYAFERLTCADAGSIPDQEITYIRKSSEHFRLALAESPRYEGELLISDPYTKLTSVWGSMALTYSLRGEPDSARWAFAQGREAGGYNPVLLEYNRNVLRSCDADAIVFTNGDNDTFPLWYLQMVEGFRPDVTAVNLNLLNIPWYGRHLQREGCFSSEPIPINLSDEELDELDAVPWQPDSVMLRVPTSESYRVDRVCWVLFPTVGRMWLRPQDLLVLNILKTNRWERPVYFASSVPAENRLDLFEFLAEEGLVVRLTAEPDSAAAWERLNENCRNRYTYAAVHDPHIQWSPDGCRLTYNLVVPFLKLAHETLQAGRKEEAREYLHEMQEAFPEKVFPYPEEILTLRDGLLEQSE